MIKQIIFDLDGTLVDSSNSILQCYKYILQKNKVKSVVKLDSRLIGPPLRETLQTITASKNEILIQYLSQKFMEMYDENFFKKAKLYDGVYDLILKLEKRFKLFIATNKRIGPTVKILDFFEIKNFFLDIYTLDKFSKNKFSDKSETIANMIKNYNFNKKETIYIGDRHDDYVSACKNGINFVMVSWGYRDFEELKNYPEYVDNTLDIYTILNRI